jgi:hypothetical protein
VLSPLFNLGRVVHFQFRNVNDLEKILKSVTPAKAGVYNAFKGLDSGFRRNDEDVVHVTFCDFTKVKLLKL